MRKVEYAVIDGQRVELTPWFDSTVMPVHDGIYETGYGFCRWSSGCWHYRADTVAEAEEGLPQIGWVPHGGKWRGLAHPQGAV